MWIQPDPFLAKLLIEQAGLGGGVQEVRKRVLRDVLYVDMGGDALLDNVPGKIRTKNPQKSEELTRPQGRLTPSTGCPSIQDNKKVVTLRR